MNKKHLFIPLLCTQCLFAKTIPMVAFIDSDDNITLQGENLPLSETLHTLANLKGLNITLSPHIKGTLNVYWHRLSWTEAIHTLKEQHHLNIKAKHNQWFIDQHHKASPLYTWHTLSMNHNTQQLLKTHQGSFSKLLSSTSTLILNPRQQTSWLWGNKQDHTVIKNWLQQNQTPATISLQVYCLLMDDHGLHDFGLAPNMSKTIAPNDWHSMLHKAGWLAMLKNLKSWGIERLLLRWMEDSQQEGHGILLAHPHLITLSGESAEIKAGIKFPISQKSSRGSISTTYQEAAITLKATPFANPNQSIDLSLDLTYDWPMSSGTIPPIIQTRHLKTRTIMTSHHTWILGGLLQHEAFESNERHTILKSTPLFRTWTSNPTKKKQHHQLLIMVVPSFKEDLQ